MHENVALEHSSKSTKYELEGSYGDPVHEHFSFFKTAKLPRECNEACIAKSKHDLVSQEPDLSACSMHTYLSFQSRSLRK